MQRQWRKRRRRRQKTVIFYYEKIATKSAVGRFGQLKFLLLHRSSVTVRGIASACPSVCMSVCEYAIVRPLSTVEYTSVDSVFRSRQWSD